MWAIFGVGIVLGGLAVVLCSRTSEENPHGRIAPRVLMLAFVSGLGFGLYFVFTIGMAAYTGSWTSIPFLVLFMVGFLYVGTLSLHQIR